MLHDLCAEQNSVILLGRLVLKLISMGFGNFVSLDKIIGLLDINSAPTKRLTHLAKEKNTLIDATCGRKTQSVLIMDTGLIVLSALTTQVLSDKINEAENS